MNKKNYEKQQKHEKVKTVLKWVAVGIGWTSLLASFICLLALGVKGCSNKKQSSVATSNVAITTTPLAKPNITKAIDGTMPSSVAELFGKTYGQGPSFWQGGPYVFEIRAVNPQQVIGHFEYQNGNDAYDRISADINGLNFDNDHSIFGIYRSDGYYTEIDARDMDNSASYSLSLYTIPQGDLYQYGANSGVISYTSDFLTQFNANFAIISDDELFYFGYTSRLNSSIAMIINRTYYQSDIVPSTTNVIVPSKGSTSSINEKISDNMLNAGFSIVDNDSTSDNNVMPRNQIYKVMPSIIDYVVYRGKGNIGFGSGHEIDVIVRLKLYHNTSNTFSAWYYLDSVFADDDDQRETIYLFNMNGGVPTASGGVGGQPLTLDYGENFPISTIITFEECYSTPQPDTMFCVYDENVVSQYGFRIVPFKYNGLQGQMSIDYMIATKNIFNSDMFIGGQIIDGNTSDSVSNVFTLLLKAFQSVGYVLGIYILPGITIGTLLFIPLVVSIVLFVLWLVKR